jgi:hypothetical protein
MTRSRDLEAHEIRALAARLKGDAQDIRSSESSHRPIGHELRNSLRDVSRFTFPGEERFSVNQQHLPTDKGLSLEQIIATHAVTHGDNSPEVKTCANCLGSLRQPRMLNCLHFFCVDCLKRVSTTAHTLL